MTETLQTLQAALGDRYTLERELGRGGMATVYLVRDLKHLRLLALKVLRFEIATALGHERFKREIQFMANLAHPHILPLLDSGETGGLLYYTMPYVEGESVRRRLTRQGPLPLEEALRITKETADALDYAHRHDVVHRDIKPENILLEEGHAVVADFGIARALSLAGGERATTSGVVVGTPAYMSPEQAAGQTELDGRTDIYSLACVLFEMLTGEPPFFGPTGQAMIFRRYTEEPPRLRALRRDAPIEVENALIRGLARSPEDRFSNASQFAEALGAAGARSKVQVAQYLRLDRARWMLYLVAVFVLLLFAGLGFLGFKRAARDDSGGATNERVAVAVFANRTGDAMLEPIGIMAADWVIRGLTRTALVDVVDLGSVLVQSHNPSGDRTEPREIGRQNGAGIVVWGNYYRLADSVVVQTSLLDVATGNVLQSLDPIRAPPESPEQALEMLQQQVMGAMATILDPRFKSWTTTATSPPRFEAYKEYVAGQLAYWQGRPAAEVRPRFQKAISEDSTFLTAQVWLAFLGANGAGCDLTDSVATALVGRQAELIPFDRLTLDISAARCRNNWEEGYELARKQASLRPRSTYAIFTAGLFALYSGHFHAALDVFGSINPEHDLGWLSDSAKTIYWRDYTAALHLIASHDEEWRLAEQVVTAFPHRAFPRLLDALALAGLRRGNDALAQLEVALRLPEDAAAKLGSGASPGLMAAILALDLRLHGDSAAAQNAARRSVQWFKESPERLVGQLSRYYLARSLMLLGRMDEAVTTVASRPLADSLNMLYLGLEGALAAYKGSSREAERIEARLAELATPKTSSVVLSQRARIAVALGHQERALQLLQSAVAAGAPRVLVGSDMHLDPIYDPLRGDPRFEQLNRGKD